jgi:DNA-directed RNA polymerase subunit beta
MANGNVNERVTFARMPSVIPIPNLIEIQKESYDRFLQMDMLPQERSESGLQGVFKSIFPIADYRDNCSLEFVSYTIGDWQCACGKLVGLEKTRFSHRSDGKPLPPVEKWEEEHELTGRHKPVPPPICRDCGTAVELKHKYGVEECIERGMTFAAPLRVTIRLVVWDKDEQTGVKSIRDIKEQDVYFGEIPLMTSSGTFIINGTERVIVSQLHRSPGVFFHFNPAKELHYAQIIPYRGSWVEFEIDKNDLLGVRIDRKRKFPATILLKALGLTKAEQIIRRFCPISLITRGKDASLNLRLDENVIGMRTTSDVKLKGKKEALVPADRKLTRGILRKLEKAGIESVPINREDLEDARAVADIVDQETGEILLEANEEVIPKIEEIFGAGIETIEVYLPERNRISSVVATTLKKDSVRSVEEALMEIYRRLRPGDPPTVESARKLFETMFFNPQAYDFSRVGRLKFNNKLNTDVDLEQKTLTADDFHAVIDYLLKLRNGEGHTDDIDHLGNRRVRCVGELLENQFRIGLVRMERAIKEKMSVYPEIATALPHDLINAKPVLSAIKEFFGSSQLSQFMDQTNPLSEITHKRRLSALGPGGLSRERAGFEVRDVHPSHYGRICPIETPEGPNIGLISSLSCYARVNEFGFIETPYRKVENAQVTDYVRIVHPGGGKFKRGDVVRSAELEREIKRCKTAKKKPPVAEPHAFYLSAYEEDKYYIAQANATLDEKLRFEHDRVNARKAGETTLAPREEVAFIDVSPKQLVSAAASLIPFLEHDDANRALMGSNMQRQAVPLLTTEAPFVGTGMEETIARDSGAVVICKRDGLIDNVDAQRIVVKPDAVESAKNRELGADVYTLIKFKRSNQNTCINQKPIIKEGERVVAGQVLADGPCTSQGELALGRNVMVAFMPWRGYNFEDAILISEKLVKDDLYTSIHIEEFEIEARDTKLGPEEITRDIPNLSEEVLKSLDDSGIIRIGARVKPGEILVGKVTPKGETQLTPEEKLLRAIFGEKAGDVRDASLYTPPGIEGVAVGVSIMSRKGIEKDERMLEIEGDEIDRLEKDLTDEIRIINAERARKIIEIAQGKELASDIIDDDTGDVVLEAGSKISKDALNKLGETLIRDIAIDHEDQEQIDQINEKTDKQIDALRAQFDEKTSQFDTGDELPPGVRKKVRVYIAMKRKLQVGDKMAGRHGNKGVIARVLPEEDMPYLPDGTPVEIVLNPLGVPSRMNVGQILETHLGWAAQALGLKYAAPVFDGPDEETIQDELKKASLPLEGKTILYDGLSGQPFEQKVTVGSIYMLKLFHMVDDKIHARSIGPYSLITQQPLGGKAQFGGQRFGEMEVWALEAYGAAHTLQELLTAKSDDVYGRSKIYEAIVKGQTTLEPGVPESWNVLVRELQSLCLDVELLKRERHRLDELVDQALAAEEGGMPAFKDEEPRF